MDAYQSFCSEVPRHTEGLWPREVHDAIFYMDWYRYEQWTRKYIDEHPNRWWELKPVEEILFMLLALPLNQESFQEVEQLIGCIMLG